MDGAIMADYAHPGIEVKNYMPSAGTGTDAALIAAMGNRGGDGIFGGGGGGGLLGGLLFGSLLTGRGGLGGGWGGGYGGVGGPAASAVASEVVLTPTLNAIQSQIGTLSNTVNSNEITNQLNTLASTANGEFRRVNSAIDTGNAGIQSSISNVATAQASGNFTTLSSINGLGRDITAAQNQGALQQLNSFNQLTTTTLQGFNEVSRDNANAFNQVQMSLNAMAAQNAACCCDIKAAIAADGSATRALINDLNVQSLTSQLNDAKLQISNTNQTIALENFASNLVSRVVPSSVVV